MLKENDKVKVLIERKGNLAIGTLGKVALVQEQWIWVTPLDERVYIGLMYPYLENELRLFTREDEIMFERIKMETDDYVAREIAKVFEKDDPKGYAEVRKQILKKKECSYFRKEN